jgi:hypothetical protein
VGILIKSSLSLSITDEYRSQDENILALRATFRGTEVVLVSIYGPNSNDVAFFDNLNEIFGLFNGVPVIIGGDWNATFSPDPVDRNIDCLNMVRIPNAMHSNKIRDMCEEFELSDPFRILYPDRQEFSYLPRFNLSQNKSRLDFFIVSDSMLENAFDCQIHLSLQNKLFDHKAVTLTINKKTKPLCNRYAISPCELNDNLLGLLVHATVAETYLHLWEGQQVAGNNKFLLLNSCGIIKTLIRECGPPFESRIGLDFDQAQIDERERKIIRIQVLCQSLDIHTLEAGDFTCDPQVVMETLLLNLKNEVCSYQSFIRKQKK